MKLQMLRYLVTFALVTVFATATLAGDGQLDKNLLEELQKSFASRGDQTAVFNAVANNKLSDLVINRLSLENTRARRIVPATVKSHPKIEIPP